MDTNLISQLSAREVQVLVLIANGHTNKSIGKLLEISELTVKTHRKHIKKKLKAQSTADLVNVANASNLI
jgi:two-component system, NarL family, response regulator NreC